MRKEQFLLAFLLCLAGTCTLANAFTPATTTRISRPSLLMKPTQSSSRISLQPSVQKVSLPTSLHSSLAAGVVPTTGFLGLDAAVAGASLAATAKLLSSLGLGGLAAKKNGLLDAEAISALSRLAYWVFQPAFLCVSVSTTLYTTAATTKSAAIAGNAAAASAGGIPGSLLAMMFVASALSQAATFGLSKVVAAIGKFKGDEARDVRMCISKLYCILFTFSFAC
jgi:uncharacterized membrane protein YeiB